jgi:hypothetical protein
MRLLPPRLLKASVARGRLTFRLCKKNISGLASDKNRRQKEKFLPNNIIKNQSTLKIKQQERRPRKGRLGGDRAAFVTPS